MSERPEIGLVLPVYDGASFIADNVRTVLACFDRSGTAVEVIVVTDGCNDDTAAQARTVDDDRVTVVECEVNRGKGAAVADGLLRSRARYVGWLDADLDIAPDTVLTMVAALRRGEHDIAVGSKRHPQSVVDYPPSRRLYSFVFQMLVRLLFRVAVRDTQVGAKLMRREVADVVVPLLLVKRYAFDLELLAVAAQFGFDRTVEVPIRLEYRFSGSGIDRRAIALMMIDTLAISYRLRIRHWYTRRFAALQRSRIDAQTNDAVPTAVGGPDSYPGGDTA